RDRTVNWSSDVCSSDLIGEDEGCAFDVVVPIPVDREGGIGFFDVERFGVALTYEKIARPDGSTAHKIYLGGFAVITRAGTGPYRSEERRVGKGAGATWA